MADPFHVMASPAIRIMPSPATCVMAGLPIYVMARLDPATLDFAAAANANRE
jgi:hypothetical protein